MVTLVLSFEEEVLPFEDGEVLPFAGVVPLPAGPSGVGAGAGPLALVSRLLEEVVLPPFDDSEVLPFAGVGPLPLGAGAGAGPLALLSELLEATFATQLEQSPPNT